MEKNSQNFSVQKAMQLANSDAGKQLLSYLQQENKAGLDQAMKLAAKGDYDSLKDTLSSLLRSDEAKALLKQLEE